MTIDDDRRGMAARLRGLETAEFDEDGELCDRGEVEDALGLATDDGEWYGALGVQRLADLIDRPTCEMTREGEGFRCSACGAFHDMSGFDEFPWPRCPECGAEVTCNG